MEPRLNAFGTEILPKFVKHIIAADRTLAGSPLDPATRELVKIRASQINGCGGCLDMHTKEAARAGETPTRINLIAAWRDSTVFTEPERAALELTEEGSRLADGSGVSDDVWASAAKHFDEEELGALVAQIAVINAFNRLNVITRQPGGNYEPGQF